MSFGVTMRSTLTTEIPSFHDTLETLTFTCGLDVYELAKLEMCWAESIANRQEVLWCYSKLSQVSLGRKSIFQKVASLGFFEVFYFHISAAYLNRV